MERLRVITLVHGTWATNAPWTHEQSKFSQALMENLGSALIISFNWSGKNSWQARKLAAEDLKRHLIAQIERRPDADHFVIGHSHGGSVALYAVRDNSIRMRLSGVVCLSTPFLIAKRRNNIFWNLNSERGEALMLDASYAGCFGLTLLAALGIALVWNWRHHILSTVTERLPLSLCLIYAIMLAAHLLSSQVRKPLCAFLLQRLRRFAESTAEIERELDLDGLDSEGIFIARSIADEASSFIGMSQIISWIVTRIWFEMERFASSMATELVMNATPFKGYFYRHFPRTLYGSMRLYLQVTGIYLAVVASGWFRHGQLLFASTRWVAVPLLFLAIMGLMTAQMLFGILITLHLVLYSLGPVVSFVMALLCVFPFGWELAIRNILLTVSAESTPKGSWKLELIEPNPDSSDVGVALSHSEIYESEAGIAKVISWIRERTSA